MTYPSNNNKNDQYLLHAYSVNEQIEVCNLVKLSQQPYEEDMPFFNLFLFFLIIFFYFYFTYLFFLLCYVPKIKIILCKKWDWFIVMFDLDK